MGFAVYNVCAESPHLAVAIVSDCHLGQYSLYKMPILCFACLSLFGVVPQHICVNRAWGDVGRLHICALLSNVFADQRTNPTHMVDLAKRVLDFNHVES